MLKAPKDLGQRHVRVVVVGEVQIDVADAEAVQARAELPGDPVRLQAAVRAGLHRVEGLGGEPRPDPARGHPAADRPLAATAAVSVGGVEPADAGLPGRVHQLERLTIGQPLAEELRRRADPAEVPAAQGDAGDDELRPSARILPVLSHEPRSLSSGRHHPSGGRPGSSSPGECAAIAHQDRMICATGSTAEMAAADSPAYMGMALICPVAAAPGGCP